MFLPHFYHLNQYKSNFLEEFSRMTFLKTPLKALSELSLGEYTGLAEFAENMTTNLKARSSTLFGRAIFSIPLKSAVIEIT